MNRVTACFASTGAPGYGSEVLAGLIRHGLGELGLPRLVAHVDPGNHASRKILERSVMEPEPEQSTAAGIGELRFVVDRIRPQSG